MQISFYFHQCMEIYSKVNTIWPVILQEFLMCLLNVNLGSIGVPWIISSSVFFKLNSFKLKINIAVFTHMHVLTFIRIYNHVVIKKPIQSLQVVSFFKKSSYTACSHRSAELPEAVYWINNTKPFLNKLKSKVHL